MNTPPTSAHAAEALPPLFDLAWLEHPLAPLARLRAEGPLVWGALPAELGGGGAWLVTCMEEAVQVLKDRRFTVDAHRLGTEAAPSAADSVFFGGRSMINVDGLDHRRLRGLVARVFTPRYIQDQRPAIQRIADELLDRVQAGGRMDLVRDFAYPLSIQVIADMLGVPPDHHPQIRIWSDTLSGIEGADFLVWRAKLLEFAQDVQHLLAEKRRQPADDLLCQLVALENGEEHLSEQELVATVALLIMAGHETTANLISIGTLMLLDHPAQLALLQADPRLVPQAVEELLRFSTPVIHPNPRFATEDVELAGQTIRRGDTVLVSLIAASHDPVAFEDPEAFVIARDLSRQIAFGQGAHICLGAPLARLEGEIAFTTLLRRMPGLRLDIPRAEVAWRGSALVRGLRALPVAF